MRGYYLIFLLMLATPCYGANYYVSGSSGNDNNSGTSVGTAFRTIQRAINRVNAGDTVFIRGGTYSQTLSLGSSVDGTSSNPITFTNYQSENVYVKGSTSGNTYTWTISGDHIIIDGLNLKMHNCQLTGNGSSILVYGSHVTITNCNFIGNNYIYERENCGSREMGIIISGADYATVSYCVFRGLPFNGIKILQGGTSNPPMYFWIHHNEYSGSYSNGTSIEGQTGQWQYGLVEYNKFGESYVSDSCQMNGSFVPNANPENYGIWYRYNEVYRNAENGIDMKGTRYITIEYNTVWGSMGDNNGPTKGGNDTDAGAGISRGTNATAWDNIVRGNIIYDNHSGVGIYDRYWVYNNTVLNNDRSYDGPNSTLPASSNYNGLTPAWDARANMFNNIIGQHRNCDVREHVTGINNNRLDYNMYITGQFKNCYYDNPTLNSYTNFNSWQNYVGNTGSEGGEQHSFIGNPGFIDVPNNVSGPPANHDFGLSALSQARGQAGHVTRANGSGSSSRYLIVDDPEGFSAGISYQNRVPGDMILVGNTEAQIASISYGSNRLNLVNPISWSNNDPVYWCPEYDCRNGAIPDIGAKQFGSGGGPVLNPVITSVSPDGTQVTGDSYTLTAVTDRDATVRYAFSDGEVAWNLMFEMNSTGGTTHTQPTNFGSGCNTSANITFKAYEGGEPSYTTVHSVMCDHSAVIPLETMSTTDSGNFDPLLPVSHITDKDITTSFGAASQTSVSVTYDLAQNYELRTFSFFGNSGGSFWCDNFDIDYRETTSDPWTIGIQSQNCTSDEWLTLALNPPYPAARYLRLTVYAPTSVEGREFAAFGFPLGGPEPPSEPKLLKFGDNVVKFPNNKWILD